MTDRPDAGFAALVDRAMAHHEAGRLGDAEDAWQAALALSPDDPGVLHNLGVVVAERGRTDDALAIFDRLVAAEPHYASGHFNRANALWTAGRNGEAIQGFRRVLDIEPDHIDSHRALGFLWQAQGRTDRAMDHFARTYDLRRGEDRTGIAARSLITATRGKLEHDAAQFRHMPPRARDGQRFEMLARLYGTVAAELPDDPAAGPSELTPPQLETLGADYNTAIRIVEAPELPGPAVSPALDTAALTRRYRESAPGIVWFDGLLTPRALALLRRFLLESTVWHDFAHIPGFVAAYLEDGLASPLLLQIADEVRAAFPDLLAPHPLSQAWAFKGLRETEPIGLHADDAAVSLNFWVTPDSANRDPGRGGLVVHHAPPPADWTLTDYAGDRDRIHAYLADAAAGETRIPYGENRAILFESRLFHGSDAPDFAPGYDNRRINITMLFGHAT